MVASGSKNTSTPLWHDVNTLATPNRKAFPIAGLGSPGSGFSAGSKGGGLRMGEMEVSGLIGHGAPFTLQAREMSGACSDACCLTKK